MVNNIEAKVYQPDDYMSAQLMRPERPSFSLMHPCTDYIPTLGRY